MFSPASLENIYLQKWIDKLQHMLRSTISIFLSSFSECKESSTSRLKIVLTKYGELLLKKVNIKDENSFDQIWGTSPTHFRLPLLRSNFQPATKSAAIILFIFMIVIITIIITASIITIILVVIMITIIK